MNKFDSYPKDINKLTVFEKKINDLILDKSKLEDQGAPTSRVKFPPSLTLFRSIT